MDPVRFEILAKVVAWRSLSMLCGFLIAYLFTGKAQESASITFTISITLMVLQWTFEVVWDKHIRERFRNVISGKQG